MEGIKEDNVEDLKKKLRSFKKEHLIFNEPHFTQQLALRKVWRYYSLPSFLSK